jgi:DNA-binding response OmpR family regulator
VPTRILVLEKRGNLARRVAAFLPGQDYGVHVAPAARSSLAFLATFQPDLILLQVEDPVDWSLLREIRARSGVPLILCSSSWNRADAVRGLRQGADDYVRWPSSPIELGARILARLRRAEWNTSDEHCCP